MIKNELRNQDGLDGLQTVAHIIPNLSFTSAFKYMLIKKSQLQCWLSKGQKVSNQRCESEDSVAHR